MAEEVAGAGDGASAAGNAPAGRKERRKAAKKEKRKQKRKELAAKEREEEEAQLNDPEEQRRIQLEEERERERMERERKEFEEHETAFLEALAAKKKAEEEEEERRKALEDENKKNQVGHEGGNDDDDWEYVEEGPPEIIWQGNEIIVKKKKVKVKRKDADQLIKIEDPNRPTSNPLPPQSEAFADYTNGLTSAKQLLENVAQQVPNFGTEQDKAHCPFHLKTGACRFGSHCSRVHFYPHKSCTLLMKNMYNGPGLAYEQDEGLEYTDEEVERSYEEFYEDVHTEFLKFGEIVNFKVCKNSSVHLRGNVYVHYKSMDSALLAYQSINGRYFAGKLVNCEFVSVTKWKVAICGEYMKSRLKTCSRGTTCNFIHCFRNPGGDYEWADWDKPPPKYWAKKMAALFGYPEELDYDDQMEQGRKVGKMIATDPDRYESRISRSRGRDSSRSRHEEYGTRRSRHRERHTSGSRKSIETLDEKSYGGGMNSRRSSKSKHRMDDFDSGVPDDYDSKDRRHGIDSREHWSDRDRDRDTDRYHKCWKKNAREQNEVPSSPDNVRDKQVSDSKEKRRDRDHRHRRKRSTHSNERLGFIDDRGKSVKKSKNEHSNRGFLTDLGPSEANFLGKVLRSDSDHETNSSSPHYERIKPCDIDSTYEYDESIDRLGDRFYTKHQTSYRETSSNESDESDGARWSSRLSKSHDSGYYSDEDIDNRGRWGSDRVYPEKHSSSRPKFSNGGDLDRLGGTSNSHGKNFDEPYSRSRSRRRGKSSHQKSLDDQTRLGSAEQSEDNQKKH